MEPPLSKTSQNKEIEVFRETHLELFSDADNIGCLRKIGLLRNLRFVQIYCEQTQLEINVSKIEFFLWRPITIQKCRTS